MKKFPMGFIPSDENNNYDDRSNDTVTHDNINPKKSVVRVFFPVRNMTLSYYNDMFDLHKGDIIYVDGKLEGLQGKVVDVAYTFKIKISDYKRVIAVADINVTGEFYLAGSHIISFDRRTIPFEKIATWFIAPSPDEVYAVGDGDDSFHIDDLGEMNISHAVADKGTEYYIDNKVCYICVDGTEGKAIVSGSKNYIVEFTYDNGKISNLVCSCFCSGKCKHEFAVMLQLRECLDIIGNEYPDKSGEYFAALSKDAFINNVFNNKQIGKINISF